MHAKATNDLHTDAVTPLQAVGRQAVASLAFCSTQARVDGIEKGRWKRKATANTEELTVGRLFKMRAAEAVADEDEKYNAIEQEVLHALTNPSWSKEVWIVAGRLLDVEKVREKAAHHDLSNRMRQLLMFLAACRGRSRRSRAAMISRPPGQLEALTGC